MTYEENETVNFKENTPADTSKFSRNEIPIEIMRQSCQKQIRD